MAPDKKIFCHAPLNNMLIDQQGKVRICCHNSNDFMIGQYPQQSLQDIWFGPVRKEMIAQMQKGQVPEACANCVQNGLDPRSPDSKIATSKNKRPGVATKYPSQIEFLLDNTCNLSCIMCASNKSSKLQNAGFVEDPINFGEDFLRQIHLFLDHVQFAVFSGGEPFLIPLYEKIWEYLKTHNPSAGIYVQTNGTILNETVKKQLAEYNIQLGISIDSLRPETYSEIRKNADLSITLKNLEYFMEYSRSKGRNMTFMVTPMTLNAFEIPDILKFCNHQKLLLSLSILNWPYRLAIWSMPASTLSDLVNHYYASVNSKDENSRNDAVFKHFISLCEQQRDSKLAFEKDKAAYLDKIKKFSAEFKAEFLHKLEAIPAPEGSTYKLRNLIEAYADRLQTKFADRLFCEDIVYLIFKDKPVSFFERLFNKASTDQVNAMGQIRMEEVVTLLESNSFDRLGI